MAPKLYMVEASPPVRAVRMCARAIGLELDEEVVNLLAAEHLSPEFVKINPQHTVPTLDDNGFILWDSHAILIYFMDKYAKDDSLYPKDVQKRAIINQRLIFDAATLFARILPITKPIIFQGAKTVKDESAAALIEAYGFLESFLEKTKYVAGNTPSIADISVITTVTSCNVVVPIEAEKFPRITAWITAMEQMPYNDINQTGLALLKDVITSKLAA